MHIGICDDELHVLQILKRMVEDYCETYAVRAEIHLFASGAELLALAEDLDLLFLDIEMPEIDGIAAGKLLRKKNQHCKIVMVTCREDRMKEAFYLEAYRFISKPIHAGEVEEAMRDYEQATAGHQMIQLWEMRQPVTVKQREIVYVQTFDSYTEFVVGNHLLRSEASLSALEKELDPRLFVRVNKKYIVNLSYVGWYDKGKLPIHENIMTVSRRKKSEFEKRYREFDLYYR